MRRTVSSGGDNASSSSQGSNKKPRSVPTKDTIKELLLRPPNDLAGKINMMHADANDESKVFANGAILLFEAFHPI